MEQRLFDLCQHWVNTDGDYGRGSASAENMGEREVRSTQTLAIPAKRR
jgi:hypothetical protein